MTDFEVNQSAKTKFGAPAQWAGWIEYGDPEGLRRSRKNRLIILLSIPVICYLAWLKVPVQLLIAIQLIIVARRRRKMKDDLATKFVEGEKAQAIGIEAVRLEYKGLEIWSRQCLIFREGNFLVVETGQQVLSLPLVESYFQRSEFRWPGTSFVLKWTNDNKQQYVQFCETQEFGYDGEFVAPPLCQYVAANVVEVIATVLCLLSVQLSLLLVKQFGVVVVYVDIIVSSVFIAYSPFLIRKFRKEEAVRKEYNQKILRGYQAFWEPE